LKTILTGKFQKAAAFIKKGEICAFPTETVYGLGANAYDEKAVRKIFKAKGRPADNPLIVHVASKKDISVLASEINDTAKKIIKQFFPGPITVILKKNEIVPDVVTAGLDSIAIRMPSLKITKDFIKSCGVPVAAPSANISGTPSPTSFVHVLQDFDGKIPCVLAGSDAKYGLESTVINCTIEPAVILRPGVITLEALKKIDKRIRIEKKSIRVKSPGQKYRHYSPIAQVRIITNYKLQIADSKSKAYIGLKHLPKKNHDQFIRYYVAGNINDYARKLFAFFRMCDAMGIKIIYAGAVPEKGIGTAIMNRLKKAIK
jgi:L-threonylcarbamoyladenylate synthase